MKRFLQFRLGCHGLPIATGAGRVDRANRVCYWCLPIATGAGRVDRANRVCLACNSGAIGMTGIWISSVLP